MCEAFGGHSKIPSLSTEFMLADQYHLSALVGGRDLTLVGQSRTREGRTCSLSLKRQCQW